jgi:hypothetical protein
MVDRLVTTGAFEVLGQVDKEGVMPLEKRAGTLDELHGILGFIDSIHVANAKSARGSKLSSAEETYRTFLFYSMFYATKLPIVICEGDTDNVYLTHAIRSLATEFPDLAQVVSGKKISLTVRLYKYPQSSTARLVDLKGGGSSQLTKFLVAYQKELKSFGGPGLRHPVILLFDNDSGWPPVRSAIRNITGQIIPDDPPFIHVTKNLYAIPTPGKGSMIEDFFDAETKARIFEGKRLNLDEESFDRTMHYGKRIFAHRIVRANAEAIDFAGFRALLSRLEAVIRYHKKLVGL